MTHPIIDRVIRSALALSALALLSPAFAAEEEQQAAFDVLEYRVLGNTLLPVPNIERAVYPFLGPNKTFTDVESARQSLEQIYRDAGYGTVFVDVPEQAVDSGIVRIRVTEGKLDRVRVTGARYYSNGRIRAALPALTQGQVPNLPDAQAQLASLNRLTADRSVVPILKAGRTPGTVDVELKVKDELPLHASVELSDRYTANTSRLRLNASIGYDNLFQRDQSFTLQFQTSPQDQDDVRAFVGSYVFRVPSWENMTFAAYAVDSQSDVAAVAAVGTLNVIGSGNIFGMRAIRTLPDAFGYTHNFTLGVDYKDFLEDILLVDNQLSTPIAYFTWSSAYTGTLRTERTMTSFNLGANFGVRNFGNSAAEFESKRFKGSPNFFYLRAGAQQLRQLPWRMQIFGRIGGQFAQSPLVSNEQFAIGGADTVRGYLESTALGDYGFSSTVELRNDWLSVPLKLAPSSAYFFVFYDAGVVSILDPLPEQQSTFDLASWGVGLRIGGWHGLDVGLDYARAAARLGTISPGDSRAHFIIRYAF